MSAEVATQKGTCDEKARPSSLGAKLVSYGLPCAHCRVYHFAHLATCPICGCGERISPNRHDGDAARVRSSNGRVGEHDSDELVNKSQMLARGFVIVRDSGRSFAVGHLARRTIFLHSARTISRIFVVEWRKISPTNPKECTGAPMTDFVEKQRMRRTAPGRPG